jgi:hypothetical protein
MSSYRYIFGAVPGGSVPLAGQIDLTQSPVYYIGWTLNNTDYIITRITMNLNVATTAEAVGDWADRYTLIYN